MRIIRVWEVGGTLWVPIASPYHVQLSIGKGYHVHPVDNYLSLWICG